MDKKRMDELVKLNLQGARTATRPDDVPALPDTLAAPPGVRLNRGKKTRPTKYRKGGMVGPGSKGQSRDYCK